MNLNYEKIVYGGSLEAFLFAYKNNLPVLYTNLKPPFLFDYLQPVGEFNKLNIKSPPNVLNSPTGSISYGPNKLQVWQKLYFLLSMSGKILYGDTVKSATIEGHEMHLNCGTSKRKIVSFDQVIFFDDAGVTGLPPINKQTKLKNIVYDWVNITSGGSHSYDLFVNDDDFAKFVYFYPSDRNDNSKLKDLVCVSYLSDEQADDFSYSFIGIYDGIEQEVAQMEKDESLELTNFFKTSQFELNDLLSQIYSTCDFFGHVIFDEKELKDCAQILLLKLQ